MEIIKTKTDPKSREVIQNKKDYDHLMEQYRQHLEKVLNRDGEETVKRHKSRGKCTARERVRLLIDPGTFFMELSALAANGIKNDEFPAAGIVTGIGIVRGKEVVIIANDATVKGGTYINITIKKHLSRKSRCKTSCPASTSLTPEAYSYPTRPKYLPTAFILAGSFTIRRGCRLWGFLRLPWSWDRVLQEGHMCRP